MKPIVLMFVASMLVGCSSGLNRPVKEVTATMDSDGVQRVRVVTHSFWFEPNRIVVHANHPVELVVENGAFLVPHNFSCHAGDPQSDVDANVGMFRGKKTARFTPTQAGEYDFFCDKDAHAKKGMTGKLVVVP